MQCTTSLIHYKEYPERELNNRHLKHKVMIQIKDLGFSYGEKAVLKNINMKLEEGCIYGLLGENGVGKTTLLTLLCGLKKPQTGTIDID